MGKGTVDKSLILDVQLRVSVCLPSFVVALKPMPCFQDCDTKISYDEFKDLVMQRHIKSKIAEKLTIDKSVI